jgi:hypothetical protein
MRKWMGAFVMVLVTIFSFGQQVKSLSFKEEVFDFGTITEQGGPVTHEFTFTNNAARPVKILTVQPSCGCTTPSWTKEPIAPTKTGSITASFNPAGRPGHFDKTLTVTTDLEAGPVVLRIKGDVEVPGKQVNDKPTVSAGYEVANGNWKLRNTILNMEKVFVKDEFTVREFPFFNGGSKPITVSGKAVSPAYIKVDVVPATLAPGAKGVIKVGYNGKMVNRYGFQSDDIEITTDDEVAPVKSFHIWATLEDYFPQLSPEELSMAPRLVVNQTLDFGRIKPNTETVREIQFSNTGKKELTIKSVQGNCNCLGVAATKFHLKPGETSSIRIAFNPEDRSGSHTKMVTIYSNDPQGPVQRITLSAYVDN